MIQRNSPDKPKTDGYQRICVDCGGTMDWEWGGELTYFQCAQCERIEPCSNIVIERNKGKVTIETGNKKEAVFAFTPSEFQKVMEACLKP